MMREETETMISLRSADNQRFKVPEALALQFPTLKKLIRKNQTAGLKRYYPLKGVTKISLIGVLEYLDNKDSHAHFHKLHLLTLFNLIQAAHFFKITSLMDFICQILVNKIKSKPSGEILKDLSTIHKRLKRAGDVLPGQHDLDKGCSSKLNSILRNRRKQTFIKESEFVDVHFSPVRACELLFIQRRISYFVNNSACEFVESKNFEQQLESLKQLQQSMIGDPRIPCHFSAGVVQLFVHLLKNHRNNDVLKCDVDNIVSILSRAKLNVKAHVVDQEVVPVLVSLVPDDNPRLSNSAAVALTSFVYAFPNRMKVIIDNNALEAAHTALKKDRLGYEGKGNIAKFLAAVCRGYSLSSDSLPSDKVKVVLAVLVDLFQNREFTCHFIHIVRACYALFYLSYGRYVAFEVEAWNIVIGRLFEFICPADASGAGSPLGVGRVVVGGKDLNHKIAGSALGVVGNIVRWGTPEQIQSLIKHYPLMPSLRSALCSEFKEFRKEACQIISNLVARSQIWIKDMFEAEVIDLLCNLLEKDKSDVKMEAAWAIFNGIRGGCNLDGEVDEYLEMVQRERVSEG